MRSNCRDCDIELTKENNSSGFKALCKPCYAKYMKNYYKNNPTKYNIHKEKYVKLNDQQWAITVQTLMAERFVDGCMDCGILNPVVLEFDHRDPSQKKFSIGSNRNIKRPISEFIEELDKCDTVCANCHRVRTAKMFGSWRMNLPKIIGEGV